MSSPRPRSPVLALVAASLAVLLGGCGTLSSATPPVASAPTVTPSAATPSLVTPTPPARIARGPALWRVADEDTTIYLFGTVHALPRDVDWYGGPIASALESADTLVTEIPANSTSDPAAQAMVASRAVLPGDQDLRAILAPADRASFESALTSLGLPVNAFDRFEPWFAGMTLAVVPLMKNGWAAESGVEHVIEEKAGPAKARAALETIDYQIGLFDELPRRAQIAFLMASANNIDGILPLMDQILASWLAGDADELARLMNQGLTDPALAQTLLYGRNADWADWIAARLDRPGTVFIAVGAGHLAGEQSVQSFLESRAIRVARVH